MTLNGTIKRLKQILTSHAQIKYYFFGSIADFLQMNDKPQHISALLVLNSERFIGDRESQTRIDFSLYIMDWSSIEVNAMQDIWNDTLLVCHDVLANMKDESMTDFYVMEDAQLTPFTDKTADALTGWKMDFSIIYDSIINVCETPN